ncbi:MAG: cysteine desulfurase family protein [Acidimicrobiales bacterium]
MTGGPLDQIAYLDHAATTPMRAEALAAMLPFLADSYGNASGSHSLARAARTALDGAREVLAGLLGASPGEVVFTSGGTEADNLALLGTVGGPGTALCSAVEHPAVFEACRAVGGRVVAVDRRGVVDLDALADGLDERVRVVSVMLVNNETGVRQPLERVVSVVRERAPGAIVHTDAVQAFGWLDVAALTADADLVSVSAHKFGGPKGVGALVVRGGVVLRPILRGGPQERERRAGTQNVAGIVAMAAAAEATARDREGAARRVRELSTRLVGGILEAVPGVHEAVPRPDRIDAICNLGVEGVEAEELLMVLDELGVCASAGSACASGAIDPSSVLLAMGLTVEEAKRHLRLSLGHATTASDIDAALAVFPEAVQRLRG